jgi:hypothetical protein
MKGKVICCWSCLAVGAASDLQMPVYGGGCSHRCQRKRYDGFGCCREDSSPVGNSTKTFVEDGTWFPPNNTSASRRTPNPKSGEGTFTRRLTNRSNGALAGKRRKHMIERSRSTCKILVLYRHPPQHDNNGKIQYHEMMATEGSNLLNVWWDRIQEEQG